MNDCSDACGEDGGTRSDIVGVCTCNTDLGVDNVCNQDCRKKSPTLSFKPGNKVEVYDPVTGETENKDLKDVTKDVLGGPGNDGATCPSGNCNVRSGGQDAEGKFQGGYSPPPVITGD